MTLRTTIMTAIVSTAVLLLSSMVVSCSYTLVEYEGDDIENFEGEENLETLRRSKIGFSVEWPEGLSEDQLPQSLTVVMNRVQNISRHEVYCIDRYGNIIFQENDDEGTEDDGTAGGDAGGTPGEDVPGTDGSDDGSENEGTDGGSGDDGSENEGTDDGTGDDGSVDEGTDDGTANGGDSQQPELAADDETGAGDEGTDDPSGSDGSEGEGSDGPEGEGDENEEVTPEPENPTPEPEPEPEDPSHPYIYNGSYSVAAVAGKGEGDFLIPELEAFETDEAVSMRSLYANIPRISQEDKLQQGYLDFNFNCPYIKNIEPLYYVRPIMIPSRSGQSGSAYIFAEHKDEVVTVKLAPRLMTRELYFSLDLELEEGVVVDRFVGVISGVPEKVQLTTGYVTNVDTGKMPFVMANVEGNTWKGMVNAFGLIAPDDEDIIVGPGILSVIIHASAVDDKGLVHTRVFHQSLNLKTAIKEAGGVMLQTVDKAGYRFNEAIDENGNPREIRSYDIVYDPAAIGQGVLKITKANVFVGDNSGLEVWNPYDGDTDETPRPGLNPEL